MSIFIFVQYYRNLLKKKIENKLIFCTRCNIFLILFCLQVGTRIFSQFKPHTPLCQVNYKNYMTLCTECRSSYQFLTHIKFQLTLIPIHLNSFAENDTYSITFICYSYSQYIIANSVLHFNKSPTYCTD